MISTLWRFLRRFEARVLIGLVLTAGALWSFLELGGEMLEGETDTFDRRLILALRNPADLSDPVGSRRIEEVVRDITALGGTTIVSMVTVVAVLVFLFHKRRIHALVMGGAVVAAWISTDVGKMLYGRARPDLVPHGVQVYSESFPSGHSSLAATTYLVLAMLIASLETRRRMKALCYVLAGVMLVSVGFSRIYLGVHWPSDVLAGWTLGAAWALLGWIALRSLGGRTRSTEA